jgi:hypothetical protein
VGRDAGALAALQELNRPLDGEVLLEVPIRVGPKYE